MNADHSLHVMFYYDHLCEEIECNNPYPHYDWPEADQEAYGHAFDAACHYGKIAGSNTYRETPNSN